MSTNSEISLIFSKVGREEVPATIAPAAQAFRVVFITSSIPCAPI